MFPNAHITGYRVASDDPRGGHVHADVVFPALRSLPCGVDVFSAERVATLASTGLHVARRVRVREAALRGVGVVAVKVGDRVLIRDRPGAAAVWWSVRGVRSGSGEAGQGLGCGPPGAGEVVMTLGA